MANSSAIVSRNYFHLQFYKTDINSRKKTLGPQKNSKSTDRQTSPRLYTGFWSNHTARSGKMESKELAGLD